MSTDVRIEKVGDRFAAFERQSALWAGMAHVVSVRSKWDGVSGSLVVEDVYGSCHVFRFLSV